MTGLRSTQGKAIPGDREILWKAVSASSLNERREAEREAIRRASHKYASGDEAIREAMIRYVLSLGDAVKKLAAEMPATEPSPVEELVARERQKLKAS